jgi:hypothetical protein
LQRRWGIAYPFPLEAPDGHLIVPFNTGDWKYMNLKVAHIDPDWIGARGLRDDFSGGAAAWCNVGATGDDLTTPDDGEPGLVMNVRYVDPGPSGVSRNFPLVRQGAMHCEVTVEGGDCYLLWHHCFLDPGVLDEACLRLRFDGAGSVFIGSGTAARRSFGQTNFTPDYSYQARPVKEEIAYPACVPSGKVLSITVRIDMDYQSAWVSIDGGAAVSLSLDDIAGLCYFGIAAGPGGSIRLRRFESAAA